MQSSNATSTKKETKKENKKLSTFSVAKVGMKLKEKAQKTQKKSVSANATAKDQMTSTKNGIEKQNNETTTSTNIGTSEVQNNGSPSATGASVPSPTIKTPPTTITSGDLTMNFFGACFVTVKLDFNESNLNAIISKAKQCKHPIVATVLF